MHKGDVWMLVIGALFVLAIAYWGTKAEESRMRERGKCTASGGVMILDAYNQPVCVKGVLISPTPAPIVVIP